MPDLRDRIAADMQLSPEDLSEKLPSGTQTAFTNRVAWASIYLVRAGALERPRRAVFRICSRGRDLLALNQPKLTIRHLSQYPEFFAFYRRTKVENSGSAQEVRNDRSETPEEQLESAYKLIRQTLASDILEAVRKASPAFFEELVVELLVAMGYGGSVEDAGKAVGKSGDGGIDGIIKEDKLGLDVVYIQAKRWEAAVGRPVVQTFAGSLEGVRARKGVLITTSRFSADAIDYVQKIEKKIVLVDGQQLADLMIDHDVGVNIVRTYKVKKLDSDYFEDG